MPLPSFDPGFSTNELSDLYSAGSTVAAILEFEAALALALADAGIAPTEEAEEVAAACGREVADPEAVLASTWEAGTPLLSLSREVDAGEWFHFGATSQDAIDTACMIQAKRALALLGGGLSSIARRLRDLTGQYRDQPQMGRTFLQDARATTFGLRTAMWLDAVLDHVIELREQRSSLPVQLGGPVGTRAAYGDAGEEVTRALADRLALRAPAVPWHTNRSPLLSLASALERTSKSMEKIGSDVALLSASSLGEIRVRAGGSSSMPGKRNPIDSVRAIAAARVCHGAVTMITSAPPHQLDRGIGSWHAEWLAVPLAFQATGAAVEAIEACLDSLEVDEDAMSNHAGEVEPGQGPASIDAVLARFAVALED